MRFKSREASTKQQSRAGVLRVMSEQASNRDKVMMGPSSNKLCGARVRLCGVDETLCDWTYRENGGQGTEMYPFSTEN